MHKRGHAYIIPTLVDYCCKRSFELLWINDGRLSSYYSVGERIASHDKEVNSIYECRD